MYLNFVSTGYHRDTHQHELCIELVQHAYIIHSQQYYTNSLQLGQTRCDGSRGIWVQLVSTRSILTGKRCRWEIQYRSAHGHGSGVSFRYILRPLIWTVSVNHTLFTKVFQPTLTGLWCVGYSSYYYLTVGWYRGVGSILGSRIFMTSLSLSLSLSLSIKFKMAGGR